MLEENPTQYRNPQGVVELVLLDESSVLNVVQKSVSQLVTIKNKNPRMLVLKIQLLVKITNYR